MDIKIQVKRIDAKASYNEGRLVYRFDTWLLNSLDVLQLPCDVDYQIIYD